MEILFWLDAFKRASANSVTAIIPYFGYAKGDKKDEPRVSIRARVCADAIEMAGADRVVTMDLHSPQIRDSSNALLTTFCSPGVVRLCKDLNIDNLVVVVADTGLPSRPASTPLTLGPQWLSATRPAGPMMKGPRCWR